MKKVIQHRNGWYAEANEDQRSEFRVWTLGLLREREVKVTFIKADGSLREMTCTLNGDLLPKVIEAKLPEDPLAITEGKKVRKVSEDAVRVFCTENNQWRSFRWDRVTAIEFTLAKNDQT